MGSTLSFDMSIQDNVIYVYKQGGVYKLSLYNNYNEVSLTNDSLITYYTNGITNSSYSIYAENSKLYVANSDQVSIKNLETNTFTDSIGVNNVTKVLGYDNNLYLTSSDGSSYIYNLDGVFLSETNLGTSLISIANNGVYSYICDNDTNSLNILNINNVQLPLVLSNSDFYNGSDSIFVQGSYTFISLYNQSLLNIIDNDSKKVVKYISLSNIRDIVLKSNIIYVLTDNSYNIYNILSSETALLPITSKTLVEPRSIFISNYMYIKYSNKIEIYSINNTSNIQLINTLNTTDEIIDMYQDHDKLYTIHQIDPTTTYVNYGQTLSKFIWSGSNFYVYNDSVIGVSPEGINWTTYVNVDSVSGLVWNNYLNLFLGTVSNDIVSSNDGITWSAALTPGNGITFNESLVIGTLSGLGITDYYTSTDAITWNLQSVSPYSLKNMVWSSKLNVFCGIFRDGSSDINTTFSGISTDGINWTYGPLYSYFYYYDLIKWIDGFNMFVVYLIDSFVFSKDGLTWQLLTSDVSSFLAFFTQCKEIGMFIGTDFYSSAIFLFSSIYNGDFMNLQNYQTQLLNGTAFGWAPEIDTILYYYEGDTSITVYKINNYCDVYNIENILDIQLDNTLINLYNPTSVRIFEDSLYITNGYGNIIKIYDKYTYEVLLNIVGNFNNDDEFTIDHKVSSNKSGLNYYITNDNSKILETVNLIENPPIIRSDCSGAVSSTLIGNSCYVSNTDGAYNVVNLNGSELNGSYFSFIKTSEVNIKNISQFNNIEVSQQTNLNNFTINQLNIEKDTVNLTSFTSVSINNFSGTVYITSPNMAPYNRYALTIYNNTINTSSMINTYLITSVTSDIPMIVTNMYLGYFEAIFVSPVMYTIPIGMSYTIH